MITTYKLRGQKPLALLTLCDTRWNSIQDCFASLLRVKTSLQQFEIRYHTYKDLPSAVKVFGLETFWTSLEEAEKTIRPLCNASYILQRDENTLVDVVLCYRDIFDGFFADRYANALVNLVEDRWKACEQPLYMLAVFLHPFHVGTAKALPYTDISSIDAACDFAVFYFQRFFPDRDVGTLRDHMDLWCTGELYLKRDKRPLRPEEFEDVVRYWSYARNMKPKSNLPDLAIAVLSIAANTATCERYFSEVGRIHTPTRNCLKADKANKAAMMRQAVREKYREEKDTGSDSDDEVTDEDSEGNKYVGRIINAAERPFRTNNGDSYATPLHQNVISRLPLSLSIPPFTRNQPRGVQRQPPATTSGVLNTSTRSRFEPGSFDPTQRLDFSGCDTTHQQRFVATGPTDVVTASDSSNDDSLPMDASATPPDSVISYWCSRFEQLQDESHSTAMAGASSASLTLSDAPDNRAEDVTMQEVGGASVHMYEGGDLPVDSIDDTVDRRSRPILNYNDPNFPQEKTLPGLRGLKVTLVDLFSLASM